MIRIGSKTLPAGEGNYYWSTWAQIVRVYRKKGGRHLYVDCPGGLPVRVTPRIAGNFTKM
jgi:hypothetical protein